MNLNEKQIALLDGLYRNPSLGLLNAPALNTYLKQQGQTGFTIKNIKEYLDSLETTQTSKLHYSNVSYVAEGHRRAFLCTLGPKCAQVCSLHTWTKCAQAFRHTVHTWSSNN